MNRWISAKERLPEETELDDNNDSMCELWVRRKETGDVHKIGTDKHDCLVVDDEGTVHYYNLQCGDGCIGYKSLKDGPKDEGYEFVPNQDDHGYPVNPTLNKLESIEKDIAPVESGEHDFIPAANIDFRTLKVGDKVEWSPDESPWKAKLATVTDVNSERAIAELVDDNSVHLWIDDDTASDYNKVRE